MFNNQKGFTLIEMLFVLMIISVLLFLIIPSFSSKSAGVHDRGCEALVQVVQAQTEMYQLNESETPTIDDLTKNDYISEKQSNCPNGEQLTIDSDGIVRISSSGD